MEKLAASLRSSGFDVVTTREPGGTPTGERIRELLLDSRTVGLDAKAELALMFAARTQHLKAVIQPALASGKIVLSDRFTDSSEAYQGGGRQLGSGIVLELHRVLCAGLQPDLSILMDSDVAASVARARRRNQTQKPTEHDESRFESENKRFFERVRSAYLEIAKREPHRVILVDARRDIETVHQEIVQAVHQRLKLPAARKTGSARR